MRVRASVAMALVRSPETIVSGLVGVVALSRLIARAGRKFVA